jgi:hypothetical protein
MIDIVKELTFATKQPPLLPSCHIFHILRLACKTITGGKYYGKEKITNYSYPPAREDLVLYV